MSKKPAPTKQAKEGGAGASAPSNRSEQTTSTAEVASLIDKKISEAVSKIKIELQSEVTKLTNQQQSQDVNTKLKQLTEEFQDSKKVHSQRIEGIEKVLSGLQPSQDQLEKRLKQEIYGVLDEKVRSMHQKDAETERFSNREICLEPSGSGEAAHQEELLKLHQQHHQDMLSVINDCCRKLKSGFNRQNKPYDVHEIHAVIDDIEQQMVDEILSEIQKTNAVDEDFSSLEQAVERSKRSGELGEARDDGGPGGADMTRMTSADMSAALKTFEDTNFDNWSEQLTPSRNAERVDSYEAPAGPIVEEVISKTQGMIAGDRGNIYYAEELKKTVDDMMTLTGNAEVKKDSVDLATEQSAKAKDLKEIEASLDSMIASDQRSGADHPPKKAEDKFKDVKSIDARIASDKTAQEDPSEIFRKDLMSLDNLIATDFGGQSSSEAFTADLLSLDAKIAADRNKAPAASASKDDKNLKSLDAMIEKDAKGTQNVSARSKEQVKSIDGRLESEIAKDAAKPHENVAAKSSGQQSTPAKDKIQASPAQSASAKPEKQPTKEAPASTPVKDSPKKP